MIVPKAVQLTKERSRRRTPSLSAHSCWALATAAMFLSRPAGADYSCPGGTDLYNENLYLYGFDVAKLSAECHVYIGNIDFYEASIVAACVQCGFPYNDENVYAVTDHNDNLLGWLPKYTNHLCSLNHSGGTELDIVNETDVFCGVTFDPLEYNGNVLTVYLGGGEDHVHGGNGMDDVRGGSGGDDLDDQGDSDCAWGRIEGEAGDDFLYGGCGAGTALHGNAGHDELSDAGGGNGFLYGGDGNECCIRDSTDSWSVMNGGAGSNVCDSASAANCSYSSTCNSYAAGAISCL